MEALTFPVNAFFCSFLLVEEDAGILMLPVVRRAGSFGVVSAHFISKDLSATSGLDYFLENVSVVFEHGQNISHINVTIIDDLDRYGNTYLKSK